MAKYRMGLGAETADTVTFYDPFSASPWRLAVTIPHEAWEEDGSPKIINVSIEPETD